MSNKIKIGIIGYGGFGEFIFYALAQSEHFRVTAIADAFKNETDVPDKIRFLSNWKEMLQINEIEAVIISTPPASHAEISLACLRAGKHVMTEKPLAISTKACQQIKIASEQYHRVAMVDFLQRFNPILEILQNLHSQKAFGVFERFYVENYAQDQTLPPSHWFWDPKISGGILLEHAVHFIDIVQWFQQDEVEHISGFADQRNASQTDRVAATVHYTSGLIASHYHSFTRPDFFERTNMRFIFSTAQFDLSGWIPEMGSFTLLGNDETLELLQKLPGFKLTKKEAVDKEKVRGCHYNYTHLMEGTFSSPQPKEELYALAIQKIFDDFYLKIKNNNHQTRVSLNDAIKAVYIAETATKNASIISPT